MIHNEWQDVAELIHQSTNSWYLANGKDAIFKGPLSDALLFCQVEWIILAIVEFLDWASWSSKMGLSRIHLPDFASL